MLKIALCILPYFGTKSKENCAKKANKAKNELNQSKVTSIVSQATKEGKTHLVTILFQERGSAYCGLEAC